MLWLERAAASRVDISQLASALRRRLEVELVDPVERMERRGKVVQEVKDGRWRGEGRGARGEMRDEAGKQGVQGKARRQVRGGEGVKG